MPPPTDEELGQTFDHYLRRAVFFDDYRMWSCSGLNGSVWDAILRIEHDRTQKAVVAARDQFTRQLENTDWNKWMAARDALDAGLIPQRRPDHPEETELRFRHDYFSEMLTTGYADP